VAVVAVVLAASAAVDSAAAGLEEVGSK